VFTEYRDTLGTLAAAFASSSPVLLHGGLTPAQRQDAAARFTSGNAPLLLATDAASEGLNLHRRCRLVVNLELPWTPVRLEQRIGRVDRIGQDRRVHAVHLLAAGTSEETSVARLVSRREHVAGMLNDIRCRTRSEADVSNIVIGGHVLPIEKPSPLCDSIITADCREPARAEAERLELTRALAGRTERHDADHRPCVTVIARGRSGHAYWIHTLDLVDRQGRDLWTTAIAVSGRGRVESRLRAHVRAWFAAVSRQLSAPLGAERDHLLRRAVSSMQAPRELAIRREHAIHHALAERHARLSAGLMQQGLFDRHHEHAAAAQQAVVDEAQVRSVVRLRELEDAAEVAIAPPGRIFALLPR
jgi:hypothetical protein